MDSSCDRQVIVTHLKEGETVSIVLSKVSWDDKMTFLVPKEKLTDSDFELLESIEENDGMATMPEQISMLKKWKDYQESYLNRVVMVEKKNELEDTTEITLSSRDGYRAVYKIPNSAINQFDRKRILFIHECDGLLGDEGQQNMFFKWRMYETLRPRPVPSNETQEAIDNDITKVELCDCHGTTQIRYQIPHNVISQSDRKRLKYLNNCLEDREFLEKWNTFITFYGDANLLHFSKKRTKNRCRQTSTEIDKTLKEEQMVDE
jgi:hypothetical protein